MKHLVLLICSLLSSSLCSGNTTCQLDTCALLSEVAAMREKLSATSQTQSTVQQNLSTMMQKMATMEANLQSYKSQVEELSKKNQALEVQLNALAGKSTPKIAFAVALGASLGPVSQYTTVIYPKIFSNINSNYNSATGIFTAPIRGVYYFTYSMFNNNNGQANSVLALMKNNEQIVATWDTVGNDFNDSATNGAVLQLEPGDAVYVKLFANRQIYDDGANYNTFRGFLLFTL
ncbi:complement C1q-like protein 2 [Parambassis ranga]|uniref:Complement C1q-like protein 2 n=1 Tax=Parambassis ranga TaxID=210632 RepID=A0A6P7HSK2_9TELE|nr:complement C1q-like protein 2 [Parambassis ranga]